MTPRAAMALFVVLSSMAFGACLTYLFMRQDPIAVEVYAPQRNMADGSVIISREPDGKANVPEPEHPKGSKVVRTIESTVSGGKPVRVHKTPEIEHDAGDVLTECPTAEDFTCPPVTVRIDLLSFPDGGFRAQVSSSTGEVLDGVDIPREPITAPIRRNSVAAASDGGRNGAILYTRHVWRCLSAGGGVIVSEGNAVPVGAVRCDWR